VNYRLDQEVDGGGNPEEGSVKEGRKVGKMGIRSGRRGMRNSWAKAPGTPRKGPKKCLKMKKAVSPLGDW
jgi:hypothetical protein